MSFIRFFLFSSLLLTLFSLPAMAIDIWPLNPQLVLKPNTSSTSKQANSALIFIDNGTVSNTRYQVRVFRWSQSNNQDVYQEQSEVQPQPPIIEFSSAAKQVIRLLNINLDNSGMERAYRLIIDEIPNAQSETQTGVKFRMRLVVPFFVYPATIDEKYIDGVSGIPEKTSPASWRIIQQKGQPLLEIKNLGNVHLRLSDVFFSRKGSTGSVYKVNQGLIGYVFAQQTMRFPLKHWQLGSGQGLVLHSSYGKGNTKVIGNE
jgi:fimbrial chaperone protein